MYRSILIPTFLICLSAHAQYLADNTTPDPAERFFKEGEKAYRSGDREQAIMLYSRALDHESDHINALLQRGFCHSLNKDYEQAVSDLSAVLAIKPDHLWAYTCRGSAYAKMDKHELAMADFNKVIQLDPKNEEAYNNRGWSRKAMGDPKGACKDWVTSKRLGNAEARIILTNNRCK